MATAAQVGLAEDQFRNVTLIVTAVKKREMPMKAAYISVATALVESGMRNIASANVPESQKSPHDFWPGSLDGLGHDHASCGMFQQQTGTRWTPAGFGDAMNQTTLNSPDGWGPPGVLMDPEKSTGLFLDALDKIKDWPNMQNWGAAQAVQHSKFADGSNYKEQDTRARSIVDALWDEVEDEFDMADLKDLDAIVRKYTDALHHDLQVILHGGVPDPKTGKVDVTHTRNLDSIFAELDAIKRKLH
jgi:hypothetical protein